MFLILLILVCTFSFWLGNKLGYAVPKKSIIVRRPFFEFDENEELKNFLNYDGN